MLFCLSSSVLTSRPSGYCVIIHTPPQYFCAFGLQQRDSDGPGSFSPTLQLEPSEKKVKMLVAQSCPTLGNPVNYSPPSSSVPRNLQARILEWVAVPFSWGSSRPQDQIQVSCIAGRFLTVLSHQGSLVDPRSCLNLQPDVFHHLGKILNHSVFKITCSPSCLLSF